MVDLTKHNFKALEDKLQAVSEDLGFLDPVTILQGFANGQDLRNHGLIYQWVLDHENENGEEPPDEWEWLELVELIKNNYRYSPVSKSEAAAAAKILTEYMHNKKKAVEITDKSKSGEVTPLSRQEIKRFKRVFDREY